MSEQRFVPFEVNIPNVHGNGVAETITIQIPVVRDIHSGEDLLTAQAHILIEKAKFKRIMELYIRTMPKESYRSVLVVHRNDTTSVYVEGLPVAEIAGANKIKIVSAKKPDKKMCDDLAVAMAALTVALLSVEPLVEQPTKPKEEHETKLGSD